ncbi:MAG: hypothetical protein RBJ76_04295 [Stenomitos frigidus ULC029]
MEQEPDMRAIKAAAKIEFGHISEIIGFGVGNRILNVYASNAKVQERLPTHFQGVLINVIVTGIISSDS